MAPRIRITREKILEASFEIIRRSGAEALNTRMIAERLMCSTQPVLYHFKTMAEIREAVYEMANNYHTRYIMQGMGDAASPFLSIGLAYIRFAYEEPELFRFLFQSNHFADMDMLTLMDDPEVEPLLLAAQNELGCGAEAIRERFLVFVIAAHGYAALLANNALAFDEPQAIRVLTMIFGGMKGIKDEKNV